AISATISGVLDSVDGMVARISGLASDAGELLDAAIDRYVEFFFLSGLIIYYRDIPVVQALALLALLGSFLVSYSTTKAEALQIDPPKGSMRRPERAVYLTLGASLSALSIPWFEARGTFAIPIGYPMVAALGLVAILANLSSIKRFRFITSTLRRREKDVIESGARESQKVVIEQPGGSPRGHTADIRL
ncbi:MAG: CDP-alcohol phosphatidyltransferase family protein, partial [Candidatus Binatia bacterium]